jgi:hypothetical protein
MTSGKLLKLSKKKIRKITLFDKGQSLTLFCESLEKMIFRVNFVVCLVNKEKVTSREFLCLGSFLITNFT